MSKYSHFEMCEKIFGSRYKFDKVKELVPYSRTDMWDKMIELQEKLSLTEKALELSCDEINRVEAKFGSAYIRANGYLVDYFKTKAKEMKSDNRN